MKESDFSDIFDSKKFEKKEDKFTETSEERQSKEKFFEKKDSKNKYEKLNIFEYLSSLHNIFSIDNTHGKESILSIFFISFSILA